MAESFYDAAATMVHYVYGDGVVCVVVVVGSGYEVVCGVCVVTLRAAEFCVCVLCYVRDFYAARSTAVNS